MGMTRDQAIQYLATALPTLLADTGITPDTDGLDVVVDDALLEMGWALADLPTAVVADADVRGYRKVLRWRALVQAADAATPRVTGSISVSSPGVTKSTSGGEINTTLDKRIVTARAEAERYLVGDSAFTTGTVSLGAFGTECAAW